MKKLYTLIVLCVLTFALSSCSEKYAVDGIENFRVIQFSYELNNCLLPSEDFLNDFEYINADYHYRAEYKSYLSVAGTERVIVVATYGEETYVEAKSFCFDNMQLTESTSAYNGYNFVENIELAVGQERYGKSDGFPRWFNMFAYNDETCTLVFMGFHSPDYTSSDAQAVRNDWEGFLQKHFFDLYDFGGTVVSDGSPS